MFATAQDSCFKYLIRDQHQQFQIPVYAKAALVTEYQNLGSIICSAAGGQNENPDLIVQLYFQPKNEIAVQAGHESSWLSAVVPHGAELH